MLNNPDPSATMSLEPHIPEEDVHVNRHWRWGGDAMNSTVTLPSEESGSLRRSSPSPTKRQKKQRQQRRR